MKAEKHLKKNHYILEVKEKKDISMGDIYSRTLILVSFILDLHIIYNI